MLNKLRLKFIILNMASVVVVLSVVFVSILWVSYRQDMQEVHEVLETAMDGVEASLEEGDGAGALLPFMQFQFENGQDATGLLDVPEGFGDNDAQDAQDSQDAQEDGAEGQNDGGGTGAEAEAESAEEADGDAADDEADEADAEEDSLSGTPPQIGGEEGETDQVVPIAVYVVDEDGSLQAAWSMNTASLSDEVLEQAAEWAEQAEEGSGSISSLGLYYLMRTIDGRTYLAFADMSSADNWKRLAGILLAIDLIACGAFFVISVFFSRWALKPVAQAWEQQKQFVADASHDLKTPLTVILANTSIVLEHPERSVASQSQWIESTQHEAESMQELVGDLLLLAQLDEGAAKPDFGRVDLSELAEGEILQFESVAFERDIALESTIAEGVQVDGNTARLRRLVTTLLDNACKYAGTGGRVDATLAVRDKAAVFSVHNTGPAIPADELPHVFDRFYRADKARTHNGTGGESGFGLGLAIAHSIAEEHGGTLSVTSTETEGTTFTASLPLQAKA